MRMRARWAIVTLASIALAACGTASPRDAGRPVAPAASPPAPASVATSSRARASSYVCEPPVSGDVVAVLQRAPTSRVGSLVWRRDGSAFFTSDGTSRIDVWDGATGVRRGALVASRSRADDLVVTADALLSVGNDSTLWRFELATGEGRLVRGVPPHSPVSPDGARVATRSGPVVVSDVDGGDAGEPIREQLAGWSARGEAFVTLQPGKKDAPARWTVWDARTRRHRFTVEEPVSIGLPSSVWSPDEARVAFVGGGKELVVRDARTGAPTLTIAPHRRPLRAVWSPDGARLVVIDGQGEAWDARRPSAAPVALGSMADASFAADGRTVLAVSAAEPRVLDVATGRTIAALSHAEDEDAVALAMRPDGKAVAAAFASARGQVVGLWDAGTGLRLGDRPSAPVGRIRAVAWSADGDHLVTIADGAREMLHWDVARASVRAAKMRRDGEHDDRGGTTFAAFSPSGDAFAVWDDAGLDVYDAATLAHRRTIAAPEVSTRSFAWGPGGKTLAVGASGGVEIRRADDGGRVQVLPTPDEEVRGVAWSADGSTIAAVVSDGIDVLDVATASKRAHVTFDEAPERIAFGPRGVAIAAATSRAIAIVDAQRGRVAMRIALGEASPHAIGWSADDGSVAAVLDDARAHVFDVARRHERATLAGGEDADDQTTESFAWAPAGDAIAIAGAGLRVCRARDGACVALRASRLADGAGAVVAYALPAGGFAGAADAGVLAFRRGPVVSGALLAPAEGAASLGRARILADLLAGCPLAR